MGVEQADAHQGKESFTFSVYRARRFETEGEANGNR